MYFKSFFSKHIVSASLAVGGNYLVMSGIWRLSQQLADSFLLINGPLIDSSSM